MTELSSAATILDAAKPIPERFVMPATDHLVDSLDPEPHPPDDAEDSPTAAVVFDVDAVSVYYGDFRAVQDASLKVHEHEITAFIGPSGCGKTTLLRCFNRMNDLISSARVTGSLCYYGVDLYNPQVDAVEVRRRIGMVFQKPTRFRSQSKTMLLMGLRWPG